MIEESLYERYPALAACRAGIAAADELLLGAFRAGKKLLICGNGGSAADAGHIAGELMKSFLLPRAVSAADADSLAAFGEDGTYLAARLQGGLPVVSLAAHGALMTAVANDTAGDMIFAQQLWALGAPGDVLLAISTSGNSRNCVLAAKAARVRGMRVIALTGEGGGQLAALADALIDVPARETYKVQELHLPVYHALCASAEAEIFGKGRTVAF